MLAVPQEIRDTATYLHAWKTFVKLRNSQQLSASDDLTAYVPDIY